MTRYKSGMDWDTFFLRMTRLVAEKSKDRSTKVGCVIVGPGYTLRSLGYNGFPRDVDDGNDKYHERPLKYLMTEHAERNALYNALRSNIPVFGCRLYVNYHGCCADCTRGIIQSGISEIITTTVDFPGVGAWQDSLDAARDMLKQARIQVRRVDIDKGEKE